MMLNGLNNVDFKGLGEKSIYDLILDAGNSLVSSPLNLLQSPSNPKTDNRSSFGQSGQYSGTPANLSTQNSPSPSQDFWDTARSLVPFNKGLPEQPAMVYPFPTNVPSVDRGGPVEVNQNQQSTPASPTQKSPPQGGSGGSSGGGGGQQKKRVRPPELCEGDNFKWCLIAGLVVVGGLVYFAAKD